MAKGNVADVLLKTPPKNGRRRKELIESFAKAEEEKRNARRVQASYDAASTSDEYKNYWANADSYDADSANSKAVRHALIKRSRYETGSNGYAAGITNTHANDLVGLGPTLRMQTGSEGFNRLVEREWMRWTKEIKLRRKLWCLAHAYDQDGEGMAVIRRNRNIKHPVKLDLCLHEAEQFTTPTMAFGEENHIDGIRFDEFGNPTIYELLQRHPGALNQLTLNLEVESIPARFVIHWFKLTRPGQHRGIPQSTSTLNLGAAFRRFREATIAKAETQAEFSVLLKTLYEPDELDEVTPMSTLDIQKRMLVALPNSVEPVQLQNNTPGAEYEAFHKSLINEQARPKSMPFNKAACDSSDYNYASGRLDHQTYYGALDIERADCNDLVLNQLFDVWFDMAVMVFGWIGGSPEVLTDGAKSHTWDWPEHQVADIRSEAEANDTKLKNGTATLPAIYSQSGVDYEDELMKQAEANGLLVDQQRQINMLLNLPQHVAPIVASMLGLAPIPGGATNGEPPTQE